MIIIIDPIPTFFGKKDNLFFVFPAKGIDIFF